MRQARFALLVFAVVILSGVPCAVAWCNGPSGGDSFGTHDWVVYEAKRIAGSAGGSWLRLSVALKATDNPDTVLRDFYYHVYDIWGDSYGNAPEKVVAYYRKALAYKKAGNYVAASKMFGIMAHYYADVCNPLHTDQCVAEDSIHSSYEGAAQTRTDARGENSGWVRFDGYDRVLNVRSRTVSAAKASHLSYSALVKAYRAGGMNSTALSITRAATKRAANGLADMIINIRRGYAAGPDAPPLGQVSQTFKKAPKAKAGHEALSLELD